MAKASAFPAISCNPSLHQSGIISSGDDMTRLKALRKERGFMQVKKQMLTGIDQSDYSKIEIGRTKRKYIPSRKNARIPKTSETASSFDIDVEYAMSPSSLLRILLACNKIYTMSFQNFTALETCWFAGQSQILCKRRNLVQIEQSIYRAERRKLLPPGLQNSSTSRICQGQRLQPLFISSLDISVCSRSANDHALQKSFSMYGQTDYLMSKP